MQEQMAKTQAELEQKTVEVSAGGGKVKVTANGTGDIIALKIDKEVVDPNDVEFLEEMVLNAVKQASSENVAGSPIAKVERVVLNALANTAALPPNICACGEHAPIVFREADPPSPIIR